MDEDVSSEELRARGVVTVEPSDSKMSAAHAPPPIDITKLDFYGQEG